MAWYYASSRSVLSKSGDTLPDGITAIDAPCRDEGGVRALLSSSTAGAQIVEHSSTKRLVPGPRSKEYEWRPSKQPINVPVPADKPHGLRQVPDPERRGARPVGCRHFVGRTDRSTDESQYAGGVNVSV